MEIDHNYSSEEILNFEMDENDADAETIGEYLVALLSVLWSEGEGFSGKRPFGNSGWEYDLFEALETQGIHDRSKQNKMIFDAIESLYRKS